MALRQFHPTDGDLSVGTPGLRVQRKAHLRELHADVGFEFARGNLVEEAVVDVGCPVGFSFRRDAFAEGVQGDQHALLVDVFGHAHGVVDLQAGDEARTELVADAGAL